MNFETRASALAEIDRNGCSELLPPPREHLAQLPLNEPPRLLITVDAEEEFDWNETFERKMHSVRSMRFIGRTHDIYDKFNIRPTYVVDYPVATDPQACENLSSLHSQGRCSIGAHLHPWTNPPHDEIPSRFNSFPGNLGYDLEKSKIELLTHAIQDNLNVTPEIYRAGRYGIGPNTARILAELNYKVDMSVIPFRNYLAMGGPDFRNWTSTPYWFGEKLNMLEIPGSAGYTGALRSNGRMFADLLSARAIDSTHIPGLLSRSRLLDRVYLTPEGMTIDEAKRVTRCLLDDGQRVFMVHYHSPSLEPGNTPYVQSDAALTRFLAWLEIYLEFFILELGGLPATPLEIHERAAKLRTDAAAQSAAEKQRKPDLAPMVPPVEIIAAEPETKCLMIATNFPPLLGGAGSVYAALANFASRSIILLTAKENYVNGAELTGWREYDARAPHLVYRLKLLRPPMASKVTPYFNIVSFLATDLPLMVRVFLEVRSIVRHHKIKVVCLGDLVYGGWLVLVCRYLLKCKVIQYIHGEEITVSGDHFAERMKSLYLRQSDAIVAVSRFTRDALLQKVKIPAEKIFLIENGVDLNRFSELPRSERLAKRYGLGTGPVLMSVGRLVERKGVDQVLRALPSLIGRWPDLKYLVIGEGPYRTTLENIARQEGITEHVVFAGALPDKEIPEHYSLCDIFVLPNREMPNGDTEGFGLVFLEANACGKPVISGRAGGVVDAVTDGVNGLTVDGNDAAAVADAIFRLLDDSTLYDSLQQGALKTAQRSGWRPRVEAFLNVCKTLVSEQA